MCDTYNGKGVLLPAVNNQYFEINMNSGCTRLFERHAFEFPSIFQRDIHFNYIICFFRLIWTCMNFHFNVLARYQREVFQFVEWNERERKRKINLASRRFDVWVSECVRVNYDEIKWNSLCMWRVWTHLSLPTILYEHAFALGNYLKISSFHAVFACALAFLMSMAHIYLSIHMYWICDVCKA